MALTQVNGGMLDSVAQQVGFRNRIINGAMMIDQRNAGASVSISASGYPVDRFQGIASGGGVFSGQQSSTAPDGFTNSTVLTVTTADSSIAATDYYAFEQNIEGYNVADLGFGTANAASVTLSFWIRSSITGTYSFALMNSDRSRSYIATYTVNSANTWEQKNITIAGDTTGTWLKTNGLGLRARFDLGSGSNRNGTAGSWASTDTWRTSGSVNWIATNGATFYITGVQLEKGSTATSFDYRPYGTELALCQRYYYRVTHSTGYSGNKYGAGVFDGTTSFSAYIAFPVTMRTYPTGNNSTASDWGGYSGGVYAASAISISSVLYSGQVNLTVSGATAGQGGLLRAATNGAWLDFSAEL